ncbi:hypothetical protein [Tenacibaculum bernardetii]|uniref:hypothetical protein n=1 Tax=Tenacibaculum bernardetii TaxID=3021375 RepID=UPI0023B037DB|nr:hypothetical protein [Tenacibaculum bernardetii]
MKKIILLCIACVGFFSCKKEKPVKDYLILSGNIENFKKRNITLEGFNFTKKIKFDKKTGSFSDTVKIDRDGYYTLMLNKKPINLYLTDTVDVKLSTDYKKNS